MRGPLQHHRNPYRDESHPAHKLFEPVDAGDDPGYAVIHAIDTGPTVCGMATIELVDGGISLADGRIVSTDVAWEPRTSGITMVEAIAPRGEPLDWYTLSTAFLAGYILGRERQVGHRAGLTLRSWVLSHFGFNPKIKRSADSVVRAGLIDRFGGGSGEKAAIGNAKNPGPLYGFKKDMWQALGIAIWYYEDVLGGTGPYGVRNG